MPESFPKNPITIGQHIRRVRMQKGLLQSNVADIIGVSTDCITYWENGRSKPQLKYYPKLASFLGFEVFLRNESSFSERLNSYRLGQGLSCKLLGKLLGVNGSTVLSWEKGKNIPNKKTIERLEALFKEGFGQNKIPM